MTSSASTRWTAGRQHTPPTSPYADGRILQSRDTRFRSGSNRNGNHRIIAIENEDRGPAFGKWEGGHGVPAFTSEQVESIARICAWAHDTHGIPLVPCPDSKPTSRGIAYHRQGIDGNWAGYAFSGLVPGGEVWTFATGKVCPGDRRIKQIPAIIARAKEIIEEEDMPTLDEIEGLLTKKRGEYGFGSSTPVSIANIGAHSYAWGALKAAQRMEEEQAKQATRLANIERAVGGGPIDVAELAAQLSRLLTGPIIAELADIAGLTSEQVEEAQERVLRRVLGDD
jgi:hypothetical protein